MANNITGASLNEIYNRLNGTPRSTPMGADTFNDWSMEAGDKVKVSRDGKEYETQVHTSTMIWKGQPQTTINSSGNEKRDPVAKISKRKYSSGTGGMRNGQEIHNDVWDPDGHVHSSIDQTASTINAYVEDTYKQMKAGLNLTSSSASLYAESLYNQMKSGLDLTSSTASLYVTNAYKQLKAGLDLTSSSAGLYVRSMYDQMKSGLNLTSSSAALYVENAYKQMKAGLNLTSSSAGLYVRNMYNQMSAGLRLTSSSLSAYVKSDYDQMKAGLSLSTSSVAAYVVDMYKQMKSGIALTSSSAVLYAKSATNAAEIVARINESTGESEIHLNSDKVFIGNERSTTVINGKCSLSDVDAEYIKSKIATISNVDMISASVTGTLSSETLNGGTIRFRSSAGAGYTYTDLKDLFITSLSISLNTSTNTYTLTANNANAHEVSSVNFSRAVTSLGYLWGDSSASSAGKLAVTAYPQNYTMNPLIRILLDGSWTGNTYNGKVRYYEGTDDEHVYDVPGMTYSISRAVTSLGYQWGSNSSSNKGKLKITASPQNYSKDPLIRILLEGSWTDNTYNGKVRYYEENDDEHVYDVPGMTYSVSRAVTSLGYQWGSSGSSNRGKLKVTASPQNYSKDPLIRILNEGSWSGRTYNGKIRYYEGNDDDHVYDVPGMSYTLTAPAPADTDIDIPTAQIYTSDRARGQLLTRLKTLYEQAKADNDYVIFRVDCDGAEKWYYMEP